MFTLDEIRQQLFYQVSDHERTLIMYSKSKGGKKGGKKGSKKGGKNGKK